jgi:hypothetical protein
LHESGNCGFDGHCFPQWLRSSDPGSRDRSNRKKPGGGPRAIPGPRPFYRDHRHLNHKRSRLHHRSGPSEVAGWWNWWGRRTAKHTHAGGHAIARTRHSHLDALRPKESASDS